MNAKKWLVKSSQPGIHESNPMKVKQAGSTHINHENIHKYARSVEFGELFPNETGNKGASGHPKIINQ